MKKNQYASVGLLLFLLLAGIKVASYHMERNVAEAAMYYYQFSQDIRLTGEGFAIEDELMR